MALMICWLADAASQAVTFQRSLPLCLPPISEVLSLTLSDGGKIQQAALTEGKYCSLVSSLIAGLLHVLVFQTHAPLSLCSFFSQDDAGNHSTINVHSGPGSKGTCCN